MSFSKQLILLVISLVLMLLLGTALVSIYHTRDYLESQLAAHSQDAATSLSLVASDSLQTADEVFITTMIDGMIHRGDYQLISIEGLDGNVQVQRTAPEGINQPVPTWFVRLFDLNPAEGVASIMSGFRQIGRVRVRSNTGLAYNKLFDASEYIVIWFVAIAALFMAMIMVGLRWIMQPLNAVTQQAEAISRREFPVVKKLPRTPELRQVVSAMNRLSGNVKSMLDHSEDMASRLRDKAYRDPLTGLANKRQFMDILADRISSQTECETGGVFLIHLNDFHAFNEVEGYITGDDLLSRYTEILRENTQLYPTATLARLTGSYFALLVEDITESEVNKLAGDIVDASKSLVSEFSLKSPKVVVVGASVIGGQSAQQLLEDADEALQQARDRQLNWSVIHHVDNRNPLQTESRLRYLLPQAITEKRFNLLTQPAVLTKNQDELHREVFLRLQDPESPGESIPAGIFMPVAESAGLAVDLDRMVLGLLFEQWREQEPASRMAINMSSASLESESQLQWLEAELGSSPERGKHLVLEWAEYKATAHLDRLKQWIAALSPLGVKFTIDQFGKSFCSFAYLHDTKVDYLKIDGSYSQALDKNERNQFFVMSLSQIATGLGMKVIAQSIETENAWKCLQSLGVAGGQGYWLGKVQ